MSDGHSYGTPGERDFFVEEHDRRFFSQPGWDLTPWAPELGVREPLVPYLQNGGFETTDTSGNPLHWDVFRDAFVDVDPALAHTGNVSVRSSFLFGFAQQMLIPVSPYQTYALQGHVQCEFVDGRPSMRNVFYDINGVFVDEEIVRSENYAEQGVYDDFWLVQEVPENAVRMTLFPTGQSAFAWPRFDDLALYTEQFHFSGSPTGEPWEIEGDVARQRVAGGVENQAYFIWGQYSNDGETTLTISENWFPARAADGIASTQTVHLLTPPGGAFLSDPGRMAMKPSGEVEVVLEAAGAPLDFGNLRRGFAKVEPAVLTSGPASPDGSLKLTAAVPGYLTSGTLRILRDGLFVDDATTVTMMGTTVRGEWDPGTNASGAYTAEFTLMMEDALSITVLRPFEIRYEPDATDSVAPLQWDTFMRGAWMFVKNDPTPAHTENVMAMAKQDGFDMLLLLCRTDQYAIIRAAAEQNDLDYIIFDPAITDIVTEYEERTWFSKHDYISRLKALLAPVQDDEHFLGVYVRDEPWPEQLPLIEKMFLSLVQDGTLGVPFTTFAPARTTMTLAGLKLPMLQVYDYPFALSRVPGSTASLLNVIGEINSRAELARDKGLVFWHMPQGYAEPIYGASYPVVPAMYSAQIGGALLAGAKGIIPFTYTSDGVMQGLRRNDLEPTAALEPYVAYNQVLERIGPVLMELDVPEIDVRVPYPFALSTAAGPGGDAYVFALNADGETTRPLWLTLSTAPAAAPVDLITEQPLTVEAGVVQLNLAPGQLAIFSAADSDVINIAAPAVQEPLLSTIALPVSHEFTVRRDDASAPLTVNEVTFNAAATAVAVSTPFQYAPVRPQVYNLGEGSMVTRAAGAPFYPAEFTGVAGDGAYYAASSFYGLKIYDEAVGFNSGPVEAFAGRTGGATSVLQSGSSTWVAMRFSGLRRLEQTTAGLESAEMTRTSRGAFLELFGPFSDGSITTVLGDGGVSNVKPGFIHQDHHVYAPMRGVGLNADMNDDNILAVPRHDRGVGMFQLAATGEPVETWTIAEEIIDARAASWLVNDILAIADRERHVRFYRIDGHAAELIHTWRPVHTAHFNITTMDAQGNRLAVGFRDGTVLIADTTRVIFGDSRVYDWSIYAE